MDIQLTHKIIKELCGPVSYKRGESYVRADKVKIHVHTAERCQASVAAADDFHVTITRAGQKFETTCSCPKLGSYDKSCQHVAAVLLTICAPQAAELFSLFERRVPRSTGHQLHFEQRQMVPLRFVLEPVRALDGARFWSLAVEVAGVRVTDIRAFLQAVQRGEATRLFNIRMQCFEPSADAVIHQLMKVARDELTYAESMFYEEAVLLIPPSSWPAFVPLLKATSVQVQVDNKTADLEILQGAPPLQFRVEEHAQQYRLRAAGFDDLVVLEPYHEVWAAGKVYQLTGEDCARLLDLMKMMRREQIMIAADQIEMFLKKVVPGLKKLGQVTLSQHLQQQMLKAPLIAKVYLDRLRNRLLVGLEFHYEQVVIQPLEDEEPVGAMVIRDVAREAEILELLDDCGFTRTEGGYFMQNDELEYAFLVHELPKLTKLAQIYATQAVRLRVTKPTTFPRIRVKAYAERTNWLEFKFEMDGVSDKQIREILVALEEKQRFYRLPNGALLSLESREMEEIQRFLAAAPIQEDSYVAAFDLPVTDSLPFLELMQDSAVFELEESFRKLSEELLNPALLHFAVPDALEDVLRDYQKQGYRWMKQLAKYGFGGVLADDMGLGKTLQSITYIVSELEVIRARKQPVLIVCPSSLTYNWLQECTRFAPQLEAVVVDGRAADRRTLVERARQVDVLITSYPLLRRDLQTYEQQQFHTIFFDEAQAFKNPTTQTARAVKKLQADYRFALTGTPMENALEELWSIYRVVFPQLFGSLQDFSQLQRKDIARRVRPFLLRRMKKDVLLELPVKEQTIESSELLPEQKQLYGAYLAKLRHDTLKHLDKETFRKNRIRILAGITRLRQLCCHPALFIEGYEGSSAKFEQLLQILQEARLSGRRVLVFSQFTEMLKIIANELTRREQTYFYLDGQIPSEERVELCDRYNAGERDVFLISLKAGGTGLNLTGADTVILYDLWWNPAVEEQAADRAYRMGQQNVVQVIKLVARGTIEEKIYEMQDRKRDLIADILQDGQGAKSLTEEDIREILML